MLIWQGHLIFKIYLIIFFQDNIDIKIKTKKQKNNRTQTEMYCLITVLINVICLNVNLVKLKVTNVVSKRKCYKNRINECHC